MDSDRLSDVASAAATALLWIPPFVFGFLSVGTLRRWYEDTQDTRRGRRASASGRTLAPEGRMLGCVCRCWTCVCARVLGSWSMKSGPQTLCVVQGVSMNDRLQKQEWMYGEVQYHNATS
ncbi:hypothetical protein F5B22DRAFT_588533 [Xylaria bambusicola]|uniref:uncharacterized protein n=1 Tax=Xylaria bambusicola TaxID=326684 RepID=UPI002008CCCD|nr:uncharacterized protein F5B22DRAFT_588533 [Xylaria bambusicola]KAI0525977.1 hypothetical protein F5B22DRAFT_588533 [Xylaria bambusicola]